MANPNIFTEIEKYIRDFIAMNGGFFNRNQILNESIEWMQKYPVEFNSILNQIENEGSRFADDSTPSVVFGGGYADDSTPSVTFESRIDDDSTPSVTIESRIDNDSIPVTENSKSMITNVFYEYKRMDSSKSYAIHDDEYSGNIMPEHLSSVADSPMGSDQVDSSPGGYSDFETDAPLLQRTMSFAPPRR